MYKPKHAAEPVRKNYPLAIVLLILSILAIIIPAIIIFTVFKGQQDKKPEPDDMTMGVVVVTEPREIHTDPPATTKTEAHTVEVVTEDVDVEFQKDLDLLARLIHAEAGSDTCSDNLQLYVGSVALNRVMSEDYPDNLHDVIYQAGQYECVMNGSIDTPATDREIKAAKWLYRVGPQLPRNVVFQAEFEQGDGVYIKEQNMYFCYVGQINEGDVIYVE